MKQQGEMVTVAEAAEMLNVSPLTIRRKIWSGQLPAFKRTGSRIILVPRERIEELNQLVPVQGKNAQ